MMGRFSLASAATIARTCAARCSRVRCTSRCAATATKGAPGRRISTTSAAWRPIMRSSSNCSWRGLGSSTRRTSPIGQRDSTAMPNRPSSFTRPAAMRGSSSRPTVVSRKSGAHARVHARRLGEVLCDVPISRAGAAEVDLVDRDHVGARQSRMRAQRASRPARTSSRARCSTAPPGRGRVSRGPAGPRERPGARRPAAPRRGGRAPATPQTIRANQVSGKRSHGLAGPGIRREAGGHGTWDRQSNERARFAHVEGFRPDQGDSQRLARPHPHVQREYKHLPHDSVPIRNYH